jgi:hypothetical protein
MRYNIPIKDWQKRTVKVVPYLLIAGLLFCVLLYIADFSVRQSIVLAVLLALLAVYAAELSQVREFRFCPYSLSIKPNWFDILTDFKIVAKPEYWEILQKHINDSALTEYSLLRDNIIFTVIQSENTNTNRLVYRSTIPYHGYFLSHIDISEAINPISFERTKDFEAIYGKDVPRLFMSSGVDGYNLGITLPDKYWNEMKSNCPKPLHEKFEHAMGRVELTLAIIPYCEFDLYWEPLKSRSTFYEKTIPQMRQTRDEQRKRFGWKKKGHPDLPELTINWPDVIEHKYFTVEHGQI